MEIYVHRWLAVRPTQQDNNGLIFSASLSLLRCDKAPITIQQSSGAGTIKIDMDCSRDNQYSGDLQHVDSVSLQLPKWQKETATKMCDKVRMRQPDAECAKTLI